VLLRGLILQRLMHRDIAVRPHDWMAYLSRVKTKAMHQLPRSRLLSRPLTKTTVEPASLFLYLQLMHTARWMGIGIVRCTTNESDRLNDLRSEF
jgi:hypothetical protein